ncbi:hypothetical protein [Rhizobium sp. NXC24]|uniref:hypothetical protein n=1 Tax=Rhizobium sp. NXC24 TaxID=2048897 RepID=UPI000CDF472E|nr:hypothetical protein [Rhizobium sp. NXC24]AVA22461.1 hypothetical protein NXC24_CH02831 [Rhizobium sp. NXC24]
MKQLLNGVEVELTPDEEAAFLAEAPTIAAPAIESVSARQFKLQLLAAGILDQVDGWVKQQSRDVQIAYEYSGSFVKSSPMMQQGFAAMGFTSQQIDEFFAAASKL